MGDHKEDDEFEETHTRDRSLSLSLQPLDLEGTSEPPIGEPDFQHSPIFRAKAPPEKPDTLYDLQDVLKKSEEREKEQEGSSQEANLEVAQNIKQESKEQEKSVENASEEPEKKEEMVEYTNEESE